MYSLYYITMAKYNKKVIKIKYFLINENFYFQKRNWIGNVHKKGKGSF